MNLVMPIAPTVEDVPIADDLDWLTGIALTPANPA